MGWLVTGGVALLLLFGIARFLAEGDPRIMAKVLKWGGAVILALVAILFALLGRFPLTLMLGGAAALLLGIPDAVLGRGERREEEGMRQQSHHHGRAPQPGHMTKNEAYEVLGLSDGATEEDVREAHKRLIKQAHPDQGGSDYLAAKVNLAKDVLLGKK